MIVTTTARPSGHPGYTETLPCTAQSAATARRLVRTALAVWGIEHGADAATLIVSELVANAVDHTDCRVIRITVTRPAWSASRSWTSAAPFPFCAPPGPMTSGAGGWPWWRRSPGGGGSIGCVGGSGCGAS